MDEKETTFLMNKLYDNFKKILLFYHDRFDKEEID